MNPFLINFISFNIIDAIDIILVAVMLYLTYNLVKGTSAINIFIGLALVYIIYIFIKAFDLELLSSIIGKFVNVGVIAIMIVFQQEIRKFLLYIGSNEFLHNSNWRGLFRFSQAGGVARIPLDVDALADACFNMSYTRTGALIVIARKSDLKFFIATGDVVDAGLSSRMLENIFYKNSPLHDGAVIIQDNRITAARCVLPVTERENFPAHLGMRHRAAVGVTENTDAMAVTVSEQTGSVSLVIRGEIKTDLTKDQLLYLLQTNLVQPG